METKIAQTTAPETTVGQALAYQNAVTNQNSQNSNSISNMNQAQLASMSAVAQVLSKLANSTPDVTGKT